MPVLVRSLHARATQRGMIEQLNYGPERAAEARLEPCITAKSRARREHRGPRVFVPAELHVHQGQWPCSTFQGIPDIPPNALGI